jgi:hypothetical protein
MQPADERTADVFSAIARPFRRHKGRLDPRSLDKQLLLTDTFERDEPDSGEPVMLGDGLFKPIFRETHFVCYRVADRNSSKIAEFRDWIYRESQTAPATDD